MAPILVIEDLSVRYGAVEALKGVTLYLDEGEIATVLGANGAGKTTLLICGPQAGRLEPVAILQGTAPTDRQSVGSDKPPTIKRI